MKTEIVSAIANAVFSYITEMDTVIFHFAGSGDHNRIKDNELEKHFEEKQWRTQLLSIRCQVTKTTLDTQSEKYLALKDKEKVKLRDWKVTKWFKQSNTLVIKSLSDHCLLKKEKGVPKFAQLRQLFMTSQMPSIINGDHGDIDLDTAKSTWDRPPAPSRPPGPRTLDSRTKAPSCLLRHRAPYLPRLLDPQKPRR